ncbi:hypothetical protein KBD33_03680 [Candidatus Gracilibacteria bacterium]|nr:hypothetical protein [Candidatus Gracilibacteria bacterium]
MANLEKNSTVPESSGDSFLKTGEGNEGSNIYGDFFQETSDGSISIGPRAQKSGLEVATNALGYIVPAVLIIVVLLSGHVYIRNTESSGIISQSYSMICPYLNYDIDLPKEEKECKTLSMLRDEYSNKTTDLQNEIVKYLTEYIPIKVSQNIMDASPERKFILDVNENKIPVDEIITRFEDETKSILYNNTECNGISITDQTLLSSQCVIYGSGIGADDSNRKLGSSRIETMRFLEELGTTANSQFILLNPPTSLSSENIIGDLEINPIFKTRTTVPVQLQYVPINQKL